MRIDQRTIGDLLSNQLMKLPMKMGQKIGQTQASRKKCSYCGS